MWNEPVGPWLGYGYFRKLMIRWFEGEQVPGDIEDLVGNIDIESDDDLYDEESEEEDNHDNGENWP